ncbi:hypothetical protein B4065_3370 [Caldibacillus thermoamylovorans]|uniref:hypothetical protein n=1 Tax=Caldibacillus thermoamylovorans TaxID=35841 RepID=UPI0005B74BA3|nr:hypothetical protein [Caldibacillus thermoamylovorans]KIO62150.1 hypothetical protein B4065_3370 [Caldibacillus thermoamylovorans]
MISSINIYDLVNSSIEDEELSTHHSEVTKHINGYDEKLETYILMNNITPTGYQNFQVIRDEVYNQTVRVKGEIVRQVIMQETYQAYLKVRNKRENGVGYLVTLCKKDDSHKVKSIIEDQFDKQLEKHTFDILKMIEVASDVRNAKFTVQIETVNSISMGGTRVNTTQYYAQLLRQGKLKAVIISYDLPSQSVTLRISVDGSILLYNQLSDNEILDLVEDLLNI